MMKPTAQGGTAESRLRGSSALLSLRASDALMCASAAALGDVLGPVSEFLRSRFPALEEIRVLYASLISLSFSCAFLCNEGSFANLSGCQTFTRSRYAECISSGLAARDWPRIKNA